MAKLTGVKTVSDHEIEYGGVRYAMAAGPARLHDIVRSETDERSGANRGNYYPVDMSSGGIVGFEDDDGDGRGIDDSYVEAFPYPIQISEITVFRRVESVPQSPTEIRALIDKKHAEIGALRAEIAELEARINIGVGDFVKVTTRTHNEDILAGEIAVVTHVDTSDIPYKLLTVLGHISDWADVSAVEKITPAEAKAALITQVEEAFAEVQAS